MLTQSHHQQSIHRHRDKREAVHNQLVNIQKKSLDVSSPEDEQEKEADTIARKVVNGGSATVNGSTNQISRKEEKIQRQPGDEWVKDQNGSMYYDTEQLAITRMNSLKKIGEWSEYKVVSFVQTGKTYWRVEMRGPIAKSAEGPDTNDGQTDKEDTKTQTDKTENLGTIALTFDDGPIEGATEEVLNTLGETPATFFLTGTNLASKPAEQRRLVDLILAKGHQVANHTYSHVPFTKEQYEGYGDLSDPDKKKAFLDNFTKNDEYFKKLMEGNKQFTGFGLSRLPGNGKLQKVDGKYIFIMAVEKDLGLVHVGWEFEFAPNGTMQKRLKYLDWKNVKGVASEVEGLPKDKDVILMHDKHWLGKGDALKRLITFLKTKFKIGKLNKSGKVE